MNSVGIDVSKGKSMIAVMRPFGEVVASPFEVAHTASELKQLAGYLKSLNGETRVIMEYTGKYYMPVARYLHEAGIFVSVVHAMLIHDYSGNTIRRAKTDKKDAIRIANYGLDRWVDLMEYIPVDDIRQNLKNYNRQYNHYMKLKTALKNNLISLLDQTFPGINTLFNSPVRQDGHEKWVDFAEKFWHCECVCGLSEAKFTEQYSRWCQKAGYYSNSKKVKEIYAMAKILVATLPKDDFTKCLISQAIVQVNAIAKTMSVIRNEMQKMASMLPEYPVVLSMRGVGETLCSQIIAEIGDVHRFRNKQALVAFAGIDAPPFQSGMFEARNRSISKRGSPLLRKALFLVMSCLMQTSPADDAVYQYLDKKRTEGKHFYVYMMAGTNKFLRIYYARVKAYLDNLEVAA
jgi:transposase